MKQSEEAQILAIRAQAIAIASMADAILGVADQCCANPKIVNEDTYGGSQQRCMNCGTTTQAAPKKTEEEKQNGA